MKIKTNLPEFGNIILNGETIADLRSVPLTRIKPGYTAIIACKLTRGDGLGGVFNWAEESTAPDDNAKTIAPKGAAVGRWIMTVGGPNYKAPESLPAPPYSGTKSVNQKLDEIIALDDARQTGDTTDDAALQRLIDAGHRRIRLRGGKGLGANGMYLIGTKPWIGVIPGRPENSADALDYIEFRGNLSTSAGAPANGLWLYGDGPSRTVIYQGDNNYCFMHNSLSENTANNLVGLRFSDLTLKGTNTGASGAQHTIALAGVTNALFERCHWVGFNSDGFIAWMGQRPDTVRHNFNHRFVECVFDGVNNQNRNAISIEDCVGWSVTRCTFDDNVSVACIDVEPRDRPSYQNGDGLVEGCTFIDSGRAAVSLYINAADYYAFKTRSFRLVHNNIRSCYRGFDISGGLPDPSTTAGTRQQILIAHNNLKNTEVPIRGRGMLGVDYLHNQHDDCGSVYMGLDNTGLASAEVRIDHNYFFKTGRTLGAVLLIDDPCRDCSFSWNRVNECGRIDNLGGWVMLGRYGSAGIRVNYNVVQNRSGKIKAFAQIGDSATVGTGAQKIGNEFYGVQPIASDNFNPPPPPIGVYQELEFGSTANFGTNSITPFDITVPGATTNRFWKARFKDYVPTNTQISVTAIGQQFGVVRVLVRNTGAAWTAPAGTTLIISEA